MRPPLGGGGVHMQIAAWFVERRAGNNSWLSPGNAYQVKTGRCLAVQAENIWNGIFPKQSLGPGFCYAAARVPSARGVPCALAPRTFGRDPASNVRPPTARCVADGALQSRRSDARRTDGRPERDGPIRGHTHRRRSKPINGHRPLPPSARGIGHSSRWNQDVAEKNVHLRPAWPGVALIVLALLLGGVLARHR